MLCTPFCVTAWGGLVAGCLIWHWAITGQRPRSVGQRRSLASAAHQRASAPTAAIGLACCTVLKHKRPLERLVYDSEGRKKRSRRSRPRHGRGIGAGVVHPALTGAFDNCIPKILGCTTAARSCRCTEAPCPPGRCARRACRANSTRSAPAPPPLPGPPGARPLPLFHPHVPPGPTGPQQRCGRRRRRRRSLRCQPPPAAAAPCSGCAPKHPGGLLPTLPPGQHAPPLNPPPRQPR
jgi:hypothetical protein